MPRLLSLTVTIHLFHLIRGDLVVGARRELLLKLFLLSLGAQHKHSPIVPVHLTRAIQARLFFLKPPLVRLQLFFYIQSMAKTALLSDFPPTKAAARVEILIFIYYFLVLF